MFIRVGSLAFLACAVATPAAIAIGDERDAAGIVHSTADTYRSDADTGERIACGVIETATME